jgi:hypothetical protein
MSREDDRVKAMEFRHPEFIPVAVSFLPATWMKYRQRLDELVARRPVIFGPPPKEPRNYDAVSGTYVAGTHIDEWGCVWENLHTGMEAMVKRHPVPTREAVRKLRPPPVTPNFKHGFMYLRLADLRGFEELMIDFAEEPPELQMLIDIVLDHNMRKLELMLKDKAGPGTLFFGDDMGAQRGLAMGPAKWRKHIKPCFARLYGRCHEKGFSVYMHTDGCIWEIIPDLIECGVNVINPQIRANGLENLVRTCKGKVCVNLDLDRQMFPFCTPADIDNHVRECVEKLGSPEGGLWLLAECGPDVPLENIEAICAALERYRSYFR